VHNYEQLFRAIERSLLTEGANERPIVEIQAELQKYRAIETQTFTDAKYWRLLVDVIFYSGFRASTVTARLPAIHEHLDDYVRVAEFGEAEITRVLQDRRAIRHRAKIEACVENARTFERLVSQHKGFGGYVDSFQPRGSLENLLLLKEDLDGRFRGLGPVTAYHFLTDIGLPVLKPDRVILRIFERLGLIEHDQQLLKSVIHGRKFAEATREPIRYVDIVLVAYGQLSTPELGLRSGRTGARGHTAAGGAWDGGKSQWPCADRKRAGRRLHPQGCAP
jgi:DNA-3-methyladenine glycosylase I